MVGRVAATGFFGGRDWWQCLQMAKSRNHLDAGAAGAGRWQPGLCADGNRCGPETGRGKEGGRPTRGRGRERDNEQCPGEEIRTLQGDFNGGKGWEM